MIGVDHCLNKGEVEHLKKHFNGFLDYLIGNLREVSISDKDVYISFRQCTEVLQQSTDELVLNNQDMFCLQAPYNMQHLKKYPGFVPHFFYERDYARLCPIWLEFFYI